VPGGSNNNNYANVKLIVEIARYRRVDAVWAGWGHASENPALPNSLHAIGIKFIGPAGPPMHALGDKIGSTIIAQTAGMPCIAWNATHVKATYDKETGSLPKEKYERSDESERSERRARASERASEASPKKMPVYGGSGRAKRARRRCPSAAEARERSEHEDDARLRRKRGSEASTKTMPVYGGSVRRCPSAAEARERSEHEDDARVRRKRAKLPVSRGSLE
jgi:biotin carboxylase